MCFICAMAVPDVRFVKLKPSHLLGDEYPHQKFKPEIPFKKYILRLMYAAKQLPSPFSSSFSLEGGAR